jgi:uncharacterized membrane protein
METPAWGLTIAYWLHMLATVVWIGGLAALALFVLPAARRALEPGAYAAFLSAMQRRFDPLAWFSLALLVATGMFQMSASPNYSGFLAIENRWAVAILVKHIVFFGMTALSAYLTWNLLPRLRRLALLRSKTGHDGDVIERQITPLETQELRLMQLNLVLGVIVLALTAMARAS